MIRIAGLVSLAFIDSVNPSAIAITLYLLTRSRAAVQVGVYIAAIFVTYFALGTTMMLGVDTLAPFLGPALGSRAGLIAQSLVGLAVLVYCVTASTDRSESEGVAPPSVSTYAALAALGVTVTAMELPTALPYFAAIALLASAELPNHEWVPLLVLYNAIFVLPPIALLVGHLVLGQRGRRALQGARAAPTASRARNRALDRRPCRRRGVRDGRHRARCAMALIWGGGCGSALGVWMGALCLGWRIA